MATYSFLYLVQNSFARCWTCLQRFLQYMSSRWKMPGGGRITLLFMIRIVLGVRGRLDWSSRFSTIRGLELTMHSTSISSVLKDSSLSTLEWFFSMADRTFQTDLIWRSHTPPMWLPFNPITWLIKQEIFTFSSSISLHALCNLFSAPTDIYPLSKVISLTDPRLAINLRNPCMKKSASNPC